MSEHVNPIRMTDNETGKVYELDFNRESIVFAERNKFDIDEAMRFPVTGYRDLFYLAFRMHHRDVAREKTDRLFNRWGGGLPEKLVKRLFALYHQARGLNALATDEEAEKNSGITLEDLD